jgi:hypothetical protein
VLARERDGLDHTSRRRATGDQRGPAVDHGFHREDARVTETAHQREHVVIPRRHHAMHCRACTRVL